MHFLPLALLPGPENVQHNEKPFHVITCFVVRMAMASSSDVKIAIAETEENNANKKDCKVVSIIDY